MENKLNENQELIYVGFWKRVLAMMIDGLIILPITIIQYKNYTNIHNSISAIWIYLSYVIIMYSYYIFFLVKFGGTPGKLVTKIRIVSPNGKYISIKQAILRNLINFIFVSLNVAVNLIIYKTNTHNSTIIANLGVVIFYVDVLFVVFNKRKRAIHDLIADSYVVTNESRLRIVEVE
jgi:uncharacterized RDD family membrane protein YckC